MMARLEIRLLGFPSVRLDGRPVDLALRKGLALVAYLADTRGPVGRDAVAGLRSPRPRSRPARGRLRLPLHKLHAAFAANAIEADRTSLSLAPSLGTCVDTHAFEAACAAGELDAAVRLYGADFLGGLSLEGCPAFEEWAFFRREALRSRLVQALERLIEAKLAAGEPRAAAVHATRLVGLDPLSESAHRHLMRAHLAAGDRPAAERQLEACARLLREELGAMPDPATLALLEEPGSAAAPQAPRAVRAGGWPPSGVPDRRQRSGGHRAGPGLRLACGAPLGGWPVPRVAGRGVSHRPADPLRPARRWAVGPHRRAADGGCDGAGHSGGDERRGQPPCRARRLVRGRPGLHPLCRRR